MGINSVDTSELDPIAYDGVAEAQIPAVFVPDPLDLADELVATISVPVTGTIELGTDYLSGADEDAVLLSITVDGVTYTYDPDGNGGDGSITPSAAHAFAFDIPTQTLTVDTDANGTFAIEMDDGDFIYTPPDGQEESLEEVIGYAVIDFDNDVASSMLTISLNSARPPIVRDDLVISNINGGSAAIEVPDWALLFNDVDPDGDVIDITAAGSATDGSIVTSGSPIETITFTDNGDEDGGTFEYTGTSNSDTDTGIVTIDREQDNQSTLDGEQLGEILIGRSSGDTILGYEGNDVLIGNGGNDTLNGDEGDDLLAGGSGTDTMTGGDGADTFKWLLGDTGTDTVTDFDPVTDGDILDFADLLVDEELLDHGSNAALAAALDGGHITITKGANTTVTIDSDGIGGDSDQIITLTGYNTNAFVDSEAIIKSLLDGGNLVVD